MRQHGVPLAVASRRRASCEINFRMIEKGQSFATEPEVKYFPSSLVESQPHPAMGMGTQP